MFFWLSCIRYQNPVHSFFFRKRADSLLQLSSHPKPSSRKTKSGDSYPKTPSQRIAFQKIKSKRQYSKKAKEENTTKGIP